MGFVGFGTLIAGAWFIDCAIKNRPPLKSLRAIFQAPSGSVQATIAAYDGTGIGSAASATSPTTAVSAADTTTSGGSNPPTAAASTPQAQPDGLVSA